MDLYNISGQNDFEENDNYKDGFEILDENCFTNSIY